MAELEDNYSMEWAHQWMRRNWLFSVYSSTFYLLSIYFMKKYMTSKKSLDIRPMLAVWSFSLAIFSTIGACYTLPTQVKQLWNHGLLNAACYYDFVNGDSGFWLFLFILSKFPELFDTYFIVLRKGPLIFLHWYHHFTVLIYCWWAYSILAIAAIFLSAINYSVHSLMYSYYGLKAIRVRLPRFVNITITMLQIIQMAYGLFMSFYMYSNRVEMLRMCRISIKLILFTFLMYGSYFVLFAKFFYDTYISKPKKAPTITECKMNGQYVKQQEVLINE